MERPKIFPLFEEKSLFCEKSNVKPVKEFVPHQSYSLSDLVQRFERGQRLPVHCNFQPGENMTNGCIYEETFDDAAPTDVHDVVDVEKHYRAHTERVKDLHDKKEKAKQAKQAKAKQAQPAPDSTPPKSDD